MIGASPIQTSDPDRTNNLKIVNGGAVTDASMLSNPLIIYFCNGIKFSLNPVPFITLRLFFNRVISVECKCTGQRH